MKIIRNTNDYEKVQADWYVKIPGKQTLADCKTHFEVSLRQLQKLQGNTMQVTAYYQANLLQEETTHHILIEFNTVNNYIIEALKDHTK